MAAGETTEALSERDRAAMDAARHRRWVLRHRARSLQGKGPGSCGKHALTEQLSLSGIAGRWSLAGAALCRRVWLCPTCSARIGQRRAEQITLGVHRWQADGGTVLMLTWTVAHQLVDGLADLFSMFTQARRRMRGRDEWGRLREEVGWVGDVGNWEVTWGEWHGWHPHRHHLAFCRPPKEWFGGVEFISWWRRLEDLWASSVASVSERHRPGDGERLGVGVRVDVVGQGEGDTAAGYVVKDLIHGAAMEVARPDAKSARAGRSTPWELLESAVAGDGRAKELWWEYAAATRNRHRVQWSRGMQERLGLEVRTDEELAEDDGDADEVEDLDDDETALLLAFDEVTPYVCEAAERDGPDGAHAFMAMLLATLTSLERAELRLWAKDRVGMAGKWATVRRLDRAPPDGEGSSLWGSGGVEGAGTRRPVPVETRRAVRARAAAPPTRN